MRIAVLSDIHGNLPALEAILDALAPYDAVWQLGDIVGYGPQPNEVIARLAAEKAVGVRGNHDSAALGELDTDSFNDDARTAVEWTAEQLEPDARAWLAALPTRSVEQAFTLVHGSPRDPTWEYVHSTAIARANLASFDTPHCLVGHTHIPFVFRQNPGASVRGVRPLPDSALEIGPDERLIINPGSVGQPRDGDPRAGGMVLDTEANSLAWQRVEYPVERVQKLMTGHRLPVRLVARLSFGL
ncbi:metallophosphoesterase family protein [soil metagenome]